MTRRALRTFERDETRRIDVDLEPKSRPVTSRWWFWTAIASAVVVAGFTVFVVSTEGPTDRGSLGTFHVP